MDKCNFTNSLAFFSLLLLELNNPLAQNLKKRVQLAIIQLASVR